MTAQPTPATGPTTSQPARLLRADQATTITATSGAALISAAPNSDPPVVVSENIYQDRVPNGTDYPPIERVLLFYAGQVILTSQWNACFPAATIGAVTPATGPHAGGTPVIINGTGFTPDSTVEFGAAAATSVVVVSPTEITCVAPAVTGAGEVGITVTTDAGAETAGNAFTYT